MTGPGQDLKLSVNLLETQMNIWDVVIAWFGWNVLAPILLLIAYLVIYGLFQIPRVIRQSRCKHDRVFETGSCDAVCIECRKNLGFIGTWRDQQKLLGNKK